MQGLDGAVGEALVGVEAMGEARQGENPDSSGRGRWRPWAGGG